MAATVPAGLPPAHHTLHPGDVVLAERGDTLETLLGSCVAILLTDPRRTVGVMCHVVHTGAGHSPADTHFAEPAWARMRALLLGRGIVPALCEASVFGGGNMFPTLVGDHHVGASNAAWALQALARERIPVLHQDLGGHGYRRVAWTIGPGEPRLRTTPVTAPESSPCP